MFEKILVCLDGSALAEEILPYAEAQATCFKMKAVLIQIVVSKFPIIVEGGAVYKEYQEETQMSQGFLEKARVYLQGVADSLKKKGIQTEIAVSEAASVGEAIVKYAVDNEISLIAIASHGNSGFRRILLGSVAEYVFKTSGLPVLMIKPQNPK